MVSRKGLILDELWHCLCPSFSPKAFRTFNITAPAKRRPRYSSIFPATTPRRLQRRCSSNSARTRDKQSARDEGYAHLDTQPETPGDQERPNHRWGEFDVETFLGKRKTWRTPGLPVHFRARPTPVLETKLQEIAHKDPNVHNAMQILRLLIRDRKVHPEARHYKWLIQCNSDPYHGSPILVRRLLSEMDGNGIPVDSSTLHAALQATAVHPDYLLRQDILRALRDRWLPLSPDGWHFVVAGLIREHQFELALDHIANMERKDIVVKDWLHSLLIYYLCEFKEFDQIHQLMRTRLTQGHEMTQELWAHVLDAATAAHHYDTTHFVWKRMVELGYLQPEHRLCTLVLQVAAQEGDTKLATSVVQFLTNNNMPLKAKDYEGWSGAHSTSGNLYAALEVLCEMQQAGLALQPSSTLAILTYCLHNKTRSREVWNILKELKSSGHQIPLACARVVIELCEKGALHDPFEVDDGIAFYKQLYTLCPEQPDTTTFNALISMCRRAKNTGSAMFAVKEMAAFGVLPDAATFEHLIIMCLECGNFESAYLYLQDLRERGFHLSQEARSTIRELTKYPDGFAARLRSHPEITDKISDEEIAAQSQISPQEVATSPTDEPGSLYEGDQLKETKREKWHPKDARRLYNKERRKRKRRELAIARAQEQEDWMGYEPSLSPPEDVLTNTDKTSGAGKDEK